MPPPKKAAKSVDEVISGLPRNEQVIVKRLRVLVLESLPKATEKITYGTLFYSRHRMICFIWPPSIYWGPKKRTLEDKGVTLGFCQGNLMGNTDGVLLVEGRKQVYCMYFNSVKEIDDRQIQELLFEADLIDEGFAKKKRRRL
jgi:Domain of unknown function (DU1801)